MTKLTKNQKIAQEKVEAGKAYTLAEAVDLVKEITFTKFDASLDVDVRLGVDPRKANQMVRGVVTLPNGTGKQVRVLVLCSSDAEAAAKATYATTDYSTIIANASGSELGKQVARFACQYIGNPYVYGGTSLTKGADCSGFIYTVYAQFNYSLPRTSYQQRSAGKSVSYEQAQPGDIICYDGHVGIYIGGGLIVHASNSKPYPSGGIKVSNAKYRTILSVRRIIK